MKMNIMPGKVNKRGFRELRLLLRRDNMKFEDKGLGDCGICEVVIFEVEQAGLFATTTLDRKRRYTKFEIKLKFFAIQNFVIKMK